MAEVAGKDGSVHTNTGKILGINSWSVDMDANVLETTEFGDDWRTYIGGLKGWSGTFSGFYQSGTDPEDNPSDGSDELALGGTVTLHLNLDATNSLSGTAVISRIGIRVEVDGVESLEYPFQGTATLTYN